MVTWTIFEAGILLILENMKGRQLIKSQIIEAWEECINTDYSNQRINSERSLQASLWSQLNQRLGSNRRLFIEPGMSARDHNEVKQVYPDIVVCNSREVIAVIELKYLPRKKPDYRKDINTLDLIARHRHSMSISNDRYRGENIDSREYTLSKNILFVWAGIHAANQAQSEPLFSEEYSNLDNCYLQLHAATRSQRAADVYYYE